jgi:hypothetical protein
MRYGHLIDDSLIKGSWLVLLGLISITVLLVRIHPEPADACCKCFDDGVAFAGVFIGVKLGMWNSPDLFISDMGIYRNSSILMTFLKSMVKVIMGSPFPPFSFPFPDDQ